MKKQTDRDLASTHIFAILKDGDDIRAMVVEDDVYAGGDTRTGDVVHLLVMNGFKPYGDDGAWESGDGSIMSVGDCARRLRDIGFRWHKPMQYTMERYLRQWGWEGESFADEIEKALAPPAPPKRKTQTGPLR